MQMLIWADEKYNTQKNSCVFSRLKKIPASFIDSIKKSLLAKISDPKNPWKEIMTPLPLPLNKETSLMISKQKNFLP